MISNIVIIGSSGHAGVLVDCLEKENHVNIIGFLSLSHNIGEVVFGKEKDLPFLITNHNITGCIIAIGDNWQRAKVYHAISLIAPSLKFITVIHPKSNISRNVSIGSGSVILAGTSINNGSVIGECCIINTNSSVDHDCIIKDFSSIAPGVTIGGNTLIGEFSAVSLGANIIHNINVGKHVVVGAGATVLENIKDYTITYGTPAKPIRERCAGDKYL